MSVKDEQVLRDPAVQEVLVEDPTLSPAEAELIAGLRKLTPRFRPARNVTGRRIRKGEVVFDGTEPRPDGAAVVNFAI